MVFQYLKKHSAGFVQCVWIMYIAVIFLGINYCSTILPYVATERSVLYREKFAGMYSSMAYSFAQVRCCLIKANSIGIDLIVKPVMLQSMIFFFINVGGY
jgi:hypothetical protein